MLFLKRYIAIIFCVLIFISTGCKKHDESYSYDASIQYEDVVCPFLYQENDSLENALKFIEVPEAEYETYISYIQKEGELISGDSLKLANKYLNLGINKNPDFFISMLSKKTIKQLNNTKKNGYLARMINKIKEGTLFKEDYKYLAVISKVSKELIESLKKTNFTQMPTHRIIFYYFYRPKYMLIGSSVYFIEENNSYKIVTETISKDKLEELHKKAPQPKPRRQEYGVVLYEENVKAYEDEFDYKYNFEISVRPDDTVNNTFEMLKLSEIISGKNQTDIEPDIAKQVLMKEEIFEKYKFDKFSFRFLIGKSEPRYDSYDQKSIWTYNYSIGNSSVSSTFYFIGETISNLQIYKNADFLDSDLELMSFESDKDGVKYKNRVLLRKTPIEKTSE